MANNLLCKKCNGTGWYRLNENHIGMCDECCPHDKGWWGLAKDCKGYVEGADNRGCQAGCGKMMRDL